MRLGAFFVAVCITVIAASAGAVVYYGYGFTGADAIIVAIAALTALALYNAVSTRVNIRSVVGPQLTELSRSGADIARQLAELGRRLAAVETKLERSLIKGENATEPLAFEISELGQLVDQLAESVAHHETRLAQVEKARLEPPRPEPPRPERLRLDALQPFPPRPMLSELRPSKPLPSKSEPLKADAPHPDASQGAVGEPASSPPPEEPMTASARGLMEQAASPTPMASEPPAVPAPPAPLPAAAPSAIAAPPTPAQATAVPPPPAPVPAMAVPARPVPAMPVVPPMPAAAPLAASAPVVQAPAARPETETAASREMLAAIRSAVEASRIDLHLQPIVTLPQRKVRFYEAMSRLRTASGDVVMAAEFISQAESGGLMPKIDNLVVFRCVQVLRRLLLKNREVGVFCNLSVATLTDAVVFPQLLEFLDANRALASSLVLELTQSGLRGAGPIENESLAALRACGFSFSMDNVSDLRLEPRELASRGFRFVKLRANLILNRSGLAADIHPGDLPDLLGRFGIDLIAEKIESEGTVVDLLDYDVKFGQGFLFSPPRPVRAEALQGIAERNDVVARDSTAPAAGAPAGSARPDPKGLRSAGLARVVHRV